LTPLQASLYSYQHHREVRLLPQGNNGSISDDISTTKEPLKRLFCFFVDDFNCLPGDRFAETPCKAVQLVYDYRAIPVVVWCWTEEN
jgi:hypothetical protein